jgi:hypothetical protein
MSLQLDYEGNNLAVVRSTGILTREEADRIKKLLIVLIKRHGKMSVLIIIEDSFVNLAEFARWDNDADDEFIQQHTKRLAIVGDLKWKESALLFFLSGLLPFSIEYFKPNEEPLARAWCLT